MGNVTSDLLIWTPDDNDTAEPDVYLATMAQSLEDGAGARLRLQEVSVGLKASIGTYTIPHVANPGTPTAVLPFTVTSTRGDFNKGFTFSGGVATVQTAGMYIVTAGVGPNGASSANGFKIRIRKNTTAIITSETAMHGTIWVSGSSSAVLNCVAGDTISVLASITGAANNSYTANPDATYLSIAMVQATPV
jgi:hypothetical protein